MRGLHTLRNLGELMRASDVAVMYGSHTGHSQHSAKRLAAELRWRLGIEPIVGQFDAFDWTGISQVAPSKTLLAFMTSYGPGGPPDNARRFWDILFNDSPSLRFGYSVFGRGSSVYDTFNRAGRLLDGRLSDLGAQRISAYGEQDRISDTEDDDYFNWKEGVITALRHRLGLSEHPYQYHAHTSVRQFVTVNHKAGTDHGLDPLPLSSLSGLQPRLAPISAQILRQTDRRYLEASFKVPQYRAGDHIVMWPANRFEEVTLFLRAVGATDAPLVVKNRYLTTYNDLAWFHININGRVTRELVQHIAQFAPDLESQKRALALSADAKEFTRVTAKEFNLGRLLLWLSRGQSWAAIPPSFLLDAVPPLQPRQYSIASSPQEEPETAKIAIVLEDHGEFKGVASSFINALTGHSKPDVRVPVAVSASGFNLPAEQCPIIMIGIGTGVAPFRAFVRERPTSPMLLVAGARTPDDLIYLREFEAAPNLELEMCYSRHPDYPCKYVQERIGEIADRIWELMEQGAHIYVCGDIRKLRHEVRKALIGVFASKKGINNADAKAEYKALKKAQRVHMDMW